MRGNVRPSGAREARNSDGTTGWTPPRGARHHCQFTVYLLRDRVDLGGEPDPDEAREKIIAAAVGSGRLTGLFGVA